MAIEKKSESEISKIIEDLPKVAQGLFYDIERHEGYIEDLDSEIKKYTEVIKEKSNTKSNYLESIQEFKKILKVVYNIDYNLLRGLDAL